MSIEKMKIDKQKVSLTSITYEKLKTFSRLNGLKMRLVLDAMTDVVIEDATLSQRIIDLAIERESNEEENKN